MKYGFVYIWRDKGKNRYYLGAHWGTEDDGYVCGSTWCRNSIRRRPQDFKRRIISRHATQEELWDAEHRLLQLIKEEELSSVYYNKHRNHQISSPMKGRHHSEKTRKKIKAKRALQIEPRLGAVLSEDQKRRQAAKMMGRIPWNKGLPMSPEYKANYMAARPMAKKTQ
jgi:hypothetical protein